MEILILAAGKSSRFKGMNVLSKVLVNFWGQRVIDMLYENMHALGAVTIMVNKKIAPEMVQKIQAQMMIQDEAHYGTGAAVQQYISSGNHDDLLLIPGDLPLLDAESAQKLVECTDADIVIGGMSTPLVPEQYGRIIFDGANIKKIIEHRFHPEKTEYVNSGVILIRKSALHLVEKLQLNASGEIFLTDIVALAVQTNLRVKMIELPHDTALGFNTVAELNELLQIAQQKWRKKHAMCGAMFYDINSVYFANDTVIEPGVIIEPNCYFGPSVILHSHAHIKAFSVISNAIIAGEVGPFAHIRSGTIEQEAQIGAFVEMNRTHVASGAKAKHLAYLGDVEIGPDTNIGAGVVICNYDGHRKHKTKIGKRVSVGANSSLVAPITIGDDAFLAAGGVYTDDVPNECFAIARSRQENKEKPRR